MDDENDLDNLFEEYENDNVTEATGGEQQTEENAEGNEAPTREVVPVPKRIIRNPRLKFDADRLCGERGIPILTKHFKNVKFKGKGHEKEDLDKLMSNLEHWSHRLFPSMKFEACLKQIEKLGKKRPVQTCLIKIRRDMPILSSDFVGEDEDDERQEMPNEMEYEPSPQDAFDSLFGGSSRDTTQLDVASTPTNSHNLGNALGTSFGGSLTEEQKKRMEYNKLLATERRKARMAAQQASSANEQGRSSPSMIDLEASAEIFSNTPESSVSQNLDQQFDSLFSEKNNSKNDSILEDSELNGYGLNTSKANESEELGLDELMDLVDEEDSPNQPDKKGSTTSVEKVSEFTKEQNLEEQFESIFDQKSEKDSKHEHLVEKLHKSICDFEGDKEFFNVDYEKNKYESINENSVKILNDSIGKDYEKNPLETLNKDFEKNNCVEIY